jgi:hypothetical protein
VRHKDSWKWKGKRHADGANDKEYGWLADVPLDLIAGVHHALSGHNNEKSLDASPSCPCRQPPGGGGL